MSKIWFDLQHFAGDDLTPDAGGVAPDSLSTTDGYEEAEEVESDETAAEDTDESTEEDEQHDEAEDESKEAKDKSEPDDTTPWVKKRLARAERAFERKFMEDINADSVGHEIPRQDLSKAVKLWNTLRVNPELSLKVNQLISTEVQSGKAKTLDLIHPTGGADIREQRLALREAKLDYRETDSVYRKYEQDILEWAEDEGLRIRTERDLKSAIREWKGAHARTLATKAEPKKAAPKAKSTVVPPTGRTKSAPPKIDYRKASAQEILEREGLSLFSPD